MDAVYEVERDRLHDRLEDLAALGAGLEADDHAGGVGHVSRRAGHVEIGQHEQARRLGGHFARQHVVHVLVVAHELGVGCGERIAEPFHEKPALVEQKRHVQPGHDVVLDVEPGCEHGGRVVGNVVVGGRDALERSDAADRAPRLAHAGAERIAALVVPAHHQAHAGGQAQLGRHRVAHRADRRAARHGTRQLVPVDTAQIQQRARPVFGADVEQERAVGVRVAGHRVGTQHEQDQVAPQQELVRPVVERRLVVGEPAQLGHRVARAEDVGVDPVELFLRHPIGDAPDILAPAHVATQDAARQDLAVVRDGCHGLAERADAQGGDRVGGGLGGDFGDGFLDVLPDLRAVQLGPVRLGLQARVLAIGGGDRAPVLGERGRLAPGRADVDAQQAHSIVTS